ncbi:MAG: helix-turn-helix transcriptional regulator [Clostridia bacterium]|nr:helix-turn-helix transcriptional regulator [Clostridia bacterium]
MVEKQLNLISVSNTVNDFNMSDNSAEWQMLYLHSGTLTVTLNASVYIMSSENLLLISPDDFYYITKNIDTHYTAIQFKISNLYDFSSSNKIYKLDTSLVELISTLLAENDATQQELLLQLLLNRLNKHDFNTTPLYNEKTRVFSKAVSIMERYVASSVSVDELAQMLRVSLSGLKRIFWKFTRIGVHEYYLMLKIKKAKELLNSGYSITRTAKVLQFSSQPYFSTTFKRVTGISAKAFSKGNISSSELSKPRTIKSKKKSKATYSTSKRQKKSTTVAVQPASAPAPTTQRSDLPNYLL